MYIKKCKYCHKKFPTKVKNQQYCSKKCRIEYSEYRKDFRVDSGNGQMCWMCANACGGCSWSRDGLPVEGWKAKRTAVRYRGALEYRSYRIIYCPQFKQDVELRVHK